MVWIIRGYIPGRGKILSPITSRSMQGLPNFILQWVPGVLPEMCTVEHSLPFNAEISNGWEDRATLKLLAEVLVTFLCKSHSFKKMG
jgi:hypothetical protein